MGSIREINVNDLRNAVENSLPWPDEAVGAILEEVIAKLAVTSIAISRVRAYGLRDIYSVRQELLLDKGIAAPGMEHFLAALKVSGGEYVHMFGLDADRWTLIGLIDPSLRRVISCVAIERPPDSMEGDAQV